MIMIYTWTCYGKRETTLDLIDLLRNLKIFHCTFIWTPAPVYVCNLCSTTCTLRFQLILSCVKVGMPPHLDKDIYTYFLKMGKLNSMMLAVTLHNKIKIQEIWFRIPLTAVSVPFRLVKDPSWLQLIHTAVSFITLSARGTRFKISPNP